jgi:large subunit ribosomal protein L21
VEPGVELMVEKLDQVEPGAAVALTDVLFFADGEQVSVGTPQLPVTVHCTCLGEEKGEKLRTVKYRRRHNYRRTYGHRQHYTRLKVERLERKGN